jgi:hypothetical protein
MRKHRTACEQKSCAVFESDPIWGRPREQGGIDVSPCSIRWGIPGETLLFEVAREQTAQQLKTSAEERALRQYVSILAVQADMVGVDLQDAQSPLVQ